MSVDPSGLIRAIREFQVGSHTSCLACGIDVNQLRRARRPALEEVESEISDVSMAVIADDHDA